MGFATYFGMGIGQTLLVVILVALKNCLSSKLVLGQLAFGLVTTARPSNLRKPRAPVETEKHTRPMGAGYTKDRPEMIFLGLFGEQIGCAVSLL